MTGFQRGRTSIQVKEMDGTPQTCGLFIFSSAGGPTDFSHLPISEKEGFAGLSYLHIDIYNGRGNYGMLCEQQDYIFELQLAPGQAVCVIMQNAYFIWI